MIIKRHCYCTVVLNTFFESSSTAVKDRVGIFCVADTSTSDRKEVRVFLLRTNHTCVMARHAR